MKKQRCKVRNKGRNRQTLNMHIIIIETEFLKHEKNSNLSTHETEYGWVNSGEKWLNLRKLEMWQQSSN